MSEIFRSHQESPYPNSEDTWRQELGTSSLSGSDHRWNSLPYDRTYPLESSTLPEGFEEVTEIKEFDETAPDSQPDPSASTNNKQPDTSWKKMNEEEVARARELVTNMFNERNNETSSTTEKVFENGTLLVRALDSPRITKTPAGIGLDYDAINNELEDLQDQEGDGLSYASSTLLLPGKRVPTYKGFGFMFDGSESELHHLHPQDSGSNGQGKDFRAAESRITSLAELAEVIQENPTPPMNEVNASFRESNLMGIFANEASKPTNKLDAWFTRHHLTNKTDKQLPLYIYNTEAGTIQQWEPTLEEIKTLIEGGYRENSVSRLAYLNELDKIINS